ncbi:FkbM family methyltransferase [Halobaculum lipolyticum]|uniref:FkbM family methyltransferase n=1 Tax=Halobaculum lipolyticum TaxID=3032001 RepID=A0ABD5WFS2_9EURY|nr:FkbM family methyltransferase [Halobaculum sp. DT31]
MSRSIVRGYDKFAKFVGSTSVASVPGVRPLGGVIERTVGGIAAGGGPRRVDYQGSALFLDPSDHVGGIIYRTGEYEPEICDRLVRLVDEGGTAIDVGGHIGSHTVSMRDAVGKTGEVFVFEPHPESSSLIEKTINENGWSNVEVFEKCLSETVGEVQLSETDGNTSCSSVDRSNDGDYTVEAIRLSEFLTDRGVQSVDVLKIDIEGAEIEVIRDLDGSLDRIEAIVLELHRHQLSASELSEIYTILDRDGDIVEVDGDPIDTKADFCSGRNNESLVWERES